MNPRENYLIAAKGGKPERVPVFPMDCNIFMPDFWMERDPETDTDLFGIHWIGNDAGQMPDYSRIAMRDIHDWRKIAKFPDPAAMDWEGMYQRYLGFRFYNPENVNIAMLNTSGLFLIPVNMMGWEEALMTICEEPEELESFISAITDFLVSLIPYIGEYFHPDIVFTGDDFAATGGPFISQEVYRSMYKPYMRKISDAIHGIGALAEFHCCGNCGYLIREFLDSGADICQLPMPNEALLTDKKELGNKLVLTGGWDRRGPGSMPGADEETVRQSVRDAVDLYGKDGALIFWDGGIVGTGEDSQNKMKWVTDEIMKYGSVVYQ